MNRRSLKIALAALATLSLAPFTFAQKSPEETQKSLQVPAGLELGVFASEPMFGNPCDMDIDAKGRVWVTEGWNYRASKLRPAGDRIQILEDTDGDGKADKASTFYQGPEINSALGICVLGNKVIVSCAPNVFVFTDTDGDGKADKKEVMFSGISGTQHDHAIHSFNFGPDGKLYFNYGNEGRQLMGADGKPLTDLAGNVVNAKGAPYRQGMVFRCNMDGSELETLGHNFRNNYEVAVDSFGTLWQSDNDDDGNRGVRINYVMEYGNFGYTHETTGAGWGDGWKRAQSRKLPEDQKVFYEWYQFEPGVVPNLLHTGAGSPTGICVYEGKLLPKVFQNQMIHCDAGPNVVRAYPVTNDGAGYKATIENLVTTGNDKWFRPADVCVAPDGSVMVADWYDPGVGGHATGDKDIKNVKGRVYRVAPTGVKYTVPALDLTTAAGACAALANPNNATRYLAWTKLNEMQQAAEPELLKLWNGDDARIRARALHLLARIKGQESKYLTAALADKDADIRITGIRLGRQLKLPEFMTMLGAMATDTSPQVRREIAIALRHNKSDKTPKIWAQLASLHDGKDRWYLEALGIGADGNESACFDALLEKVGAANILNTPAGRDLVWRIRSDKTPALLVKIITDKSLSSEDKVRYFRSFDYLKTDGKNEALLSLLDQSGGDRTILVETLGRLKNLDAAKQAQVKGQVSKILDAVKGSAEVVSLAEQFDVKDRSADLLAYVVANPTDAASGTAIKLLAKNDPKALEQAIAGADGAKLTAALGASTDKSIIKLLTDIGSDAKRALPLRQASITALTRSKPGSTALLDLARNKKLSDDVQPLAASLLHNSTHKDIRDEAAKLIPLPKGKGATELATIPKLIEIKGDAVKGKEIFTTATCITCHVVGGAGTSYGPELSEIGNKLSKEALYTSILYPNAGISVGYEGAVIVLKDGDDLDGIVTSETAEQLNLRRAGGINTTVKKSEIKDRRLMKLSIMPEGLIMQMNQQELVDLVEYMTTLKKAGK